MNKKIVSSLVLGVLAFMLVMPAGRVWAQTGDASIEALQKQVGQLLEMIKSLQAQIEAIRSGVKPPIISIRPEPERGWDTINGTLQAQNLDGRTSFYMWGTHQITEPTRLTYPTQGGKTYLVKVVNDEVLLMLKKYEGQNVTLWGQLQYQNIEGGFWGFIAKKVITGTTTECPLPAAGTKIGYSGESVKVIQEVLKTDKSVYPEGLVTGYYGPLTARAVTKFQTKVGLPATGVLDTETRERIEAKLEATSQSVPGSMGVSVQVDSSIEDRIEDRVIRCPIPPKPIPPKPIPPDTDTNRGFKVYSPSAGEEWQVGRTEKIAWEQVFQTLTAPATGVANTTFAPVGAVRITLLRYYACLYDDRAPCLIAERPYVISEKTDNDGIFEWAIPADLATQYQGKMIITVSAVDSGLSGRSAVFVIGSGSTGRNLPPVVSGVSGPTVLKVGETGTWTVKAYDPENGSLSYSVNWGDEVTATAPGYPYIKEAAGQSATFTHVYSNAGTYYPTFVVTDNQGLSAKTSISVVVGGGGTTNSPPVIVGVPSIPSSIVTGQTVSFSWSAKDPDEDVMSWSVNWGDGSEMGVACAQPSGDLITDNCGTFNASHAWSQTGTYTVVAKVWDPKGGSDTHKFNVVVGGGGTTNSPPKITAISAIPTPIYVGEQANFSWSATDADGDRLSWSVNWGDSALVSPSVTCLTSDGSNPNCWNFNAGHTWNNAGTYTVKVTVTDTKGASDSYSFNVTVVAGTVLNSPPVIGMFAGPATVGANTQNWFKIEASDPNPGGWLWYLIDWGDASGGQLKTKWIGTVATMGGQQYVVGDAFREQNGVEFVAANHTYDWTKPGVYNLTLTVSDENGLSAIKTASVVVGGGGTTNSPPVIESVTGLTTVKVADIVTWTVKAYDPEGSALTYRVDWGDGNVSTQPNSRIDSKTVTFYNVYAVTGVYSVSVTVTDDKGLTARKTISIYVGPKDRAYQTLQLKLGWNFISFNRLPETARGLRDVFKDQLADVDVIITREDDRELKYDPRNNLETLTQLEYNNGYKIYANKDFTLYVSGVAPTQAEATTRLFYVSSNYFNYVGYPNDKEMSVGDFFNSIKDKVNIVKAGDGSFWIPGVLTTSLQTLKPGQGYEVSVKEDVSLVMPVFWR